VGHVIAQADTFRTLKTSVPPNATTHLVRFTCLTQSFQVPFGFLSMMGCRRFRRVWQASWWEVRRI